ncbi:MAG: Nif3-like dinuclear metal center hexameric protein [Gemmatimonadota bacterium]
MKLESLLQYMGEYLGVADHPEYDRGLNGLQVDGPREVTKVAAAVDASLASIEAAAEAGADLLIVHHGLFWDGLRPVTGRRYRRIKALIERGIALYSCHLPLDSHPEIGNCAMLARAIGLSLDGRIGEYRGAPLGWTGTFPDAVDLAGLKQKTEAAVGGDVQVLPGGPVEIRRVGVITGNAGSLTEEAAAAGLDAFVTGEGAHQHAFDAAEFGIHLLFAGHYATETFGVRALAEHVAERFSLEHVFIDQPTGL